MNGIICINKPHGFTSFDVIAKMRGILRYRKLGHSGTLDPIATGVLPVFFGKATKAIDILPNTDKEYKAGFKLGVSTDTLDITGNVTKTADSFNISSEIITSKLSEFVGEISQIPPMYSAVSVNGVKLYKLARQGIEVERNPRKTTVYSITLDSFDGVSEGFISVSCGAGTYIRTIIHDLGELLGCHAVMTNLIRTKACGFTLDNCITFEDLQQFGTEKFIIPIDSIFERYPKIVLNETQEKMYKNGVKLDADRCKKNSENYDDKLYRVYGANDDFIGISLIENKELRTVKNLYD